MGLLALAELVGADLLGRLSQYTDGWHFDARASSMRFWGLCLLLLLLKIAFVRFFQNYRPSAQLLGILISVTAIVTWLIAGWFWLAMMGGHKVL